MAGPGGGGRLRRHEIGRRQPARPDGPLRRRPRLFSLQGIHRPLAVRPHPRRPRPLRCRGQRPRPGAAVLAGRRQEGDVMETVRVAAVQAAPVFLAREETVDKAVGLIEKAAAGGAGLVVFPETFVPTYPDWVWRTRPWDGHASALYARLLDQAVVVPSPATETLGAAAARAGVWLSIGVDELDRHSTTLYNSQLLFDADGRLMQCHRKLMPTGGERLVWGFGDGSTLGVVETPFGLVGTLACWENYMPLARAALYGQGVDIYLAPTWDNSDVWVASMRHIAKEGRVFEIGRAHV